MKNRLMTMAGGIALLAVLGKFVAVPAVAQAVRAALVKNIDEQGRNPYSATFTCSYQGNLGDCSAPAAQVPAGMRLVIEQVNAQISIDAGSQMIEAAVYVGDDVDKFLQPVLVSSLLNRYVVNSHVLIYAEAGVTPRFYLHTTTNGSVLGTLTGYLVNLSN